MTFRNTVVKIKELLIYKEHCPKKSQHFSGQKPLGVSSVKVPALRGNLWIMYCKHPVVFFNAILIIFSICTSWHPTVNKALISTFWIQCIYTSFLQSKKSKYGSKTWCSDTGPTIVESTFYFSLQIPAF